MKKNTVIAIVCLTVGICIGFFAGRQTITYETEIKYVRGDVVRDTIHLPVPVYEVVHDTICLIEHDTIKTLIDWNTERFYTWQPINDNRGIVDISAMVQFNRVQSMSAEFVPIYKEITRYKKKVWQPYISASYSTFGIVGLGGGLFYNDVGLEYGFQYSMFENRTGYLVGLKYKF